MEVGKLRSFSEVEFPKETILHQFTPGSYLSYLESGWLQKQHMGSFNVEEEEGRGAR